MAAVAVVALPCAVGGVLVALYTGEPRWIVVGVPFALAVFVAGRFAPTGYRLGADGVRVERRAGAALIRYGDIVAVDRAPRRLTGMSVLASRGIFGVFGRFWSSSLGFYRLFLTNRDAVVWLGTREGWVGISPDRPDDFVTRLRGRLDG